VPAVVTDHCLQCSPPPRADGRPACRTATTCGAAVDGVEFNDVKPAGVVEHSTGSPPHAHTECYHAGVWPACELPATTRSYTFTLRYYTVTVHTLVQPPHVTMRILRCTARNRQVHTDVYSILAWRKPVYATPRYHTPHCAAFWQPRGIHIPRQMNCRQCGYGRS